MVVHVKRLAGPVAIGIAGVLTLTTIAVPLQAQESDSTALLGPATIQLGAFQERFGDRPRIDWNLELRTPRHIWGFPMETGVVPTTLAEWEELAREILDSYPDLFGASSSELVTAQVKRIPLSHVGLTDKIAVTFRQAVGDLPVRGGWATVVFDTRGRILSIRNELLPGADLLSPTPSISERSAFAAATRALGYPLLEVRSVEFAIVPMRGKWGRLPALAYLFDLRADASDNGVPIGRLIAVDAHTGEVLWADSTVHTTDLIGNTNGWATPGSKAPSGTNPPALTPLGRVRMSSAVGNTNTEMNGDWTITYSGSDNQTVTTNFGSASTFFWVDDYGDSDSQISKLVTPGVPIQFTYNEGKTEYDTAEVNGAQHVVTFREYVRAQDPTDSTMDFRVRTNVNLNNNCNAYYDGVSINFFRAGGGCNNTAYSTVIAHEEGHWANDLYDSGNGWDGFGEGNADNFGMYIFDTPIVGEDFFTNGGDIRDGRNTRQYCGSCGAGCYGEVHVDGEVLMGAFWKWRRNLNTSLGDAMGDAIADSLFMAWMNVYDEYQICHTNEETLLVLDDDDGDIYNGTPHFADIDGGFREQGFPGVDLDMITITHTPVAEQQGENPVPIVATITSVAGSITTARVYYSVNDGSSYPYVNMTPTGNPNEYSGTIPTQSAPEAVYYYIYAQDSSANVETSPSDAPSVDRYAYYVGTVTTIALFTFDGSSDEGWTHSGSGQDDWQRGAPQGKATDPGSAYSGTKVWANDLGNSGWDGYYEANVSNSLKSPTFNLSGHTGTRLKLRRWLGVEKSQYDHARLKVNSTTIFENAYGSDQVDSDWWNIEYDISAIADNNSSVQVTFEMVSDAGLEYGGWTIDDFRILTVADEGGPPGDCVDPVIYGVPTTGSGGINPTIGWDNGWPSIGNPSWKVTCTNTLGGATGAVIVGFKETYDDSGPFVLLVDLNGPPKAVIFPVYYSGSGPGGGSATLTIGIPNNPYLPGLHVYFQFMIYDPGAAKGVAASQGLHAILCDPNG
ncbi:MAG: hypothetical protein AB1486_26175 [Planctomycetota bacterium]